MRLFKSQLYNILIASTLLAWLPISTNADCCFSEQIEKQFGSTFIYTIKPSSSKLLTTMKMDVSFASDHTTELQTANKAKCTKGSGNGWTCDIERYSATVQFKIVLVGNNGNPTSIVNIANENCVKKDVCSDNPEVKTQTTADDENKGKINLGFLGFVAPEVFYPVLIGLILTFFGVAFMAWRRNHGMRAGDPEEQLSQSRNGTGFYGEKKDENADKDGYSSYSKKAGQSSPSSRSKSRSTANRKTIASVENSSDEENISSSNSRKSSSRRTRERPTPTASTAKETPEKDQSSSDEEALGAKLAKSKTRSSRSRPKSTANRKTLIVLEEPESKEQVKQEDLNAVDSETLRKKQTVSRRKGEGSRRSDSERRRKKRVSKPLVEL